MKPLVALQRWARAIKRDIIALWLATKDPRVPLYAKLAAGFVAAYALSPIDLIPDFIPILGYLDDLILVPLGIIVVVRMMPREVIADLRQQAALIADACRLIENAEHEPTLEVLAQFAGLSPFHFHRIFKSVVGVTPKAYGAAQRGKRVREHLKTSRTVTQAIHEAGFNSSGRFYAASGQLLGMAPKAYRARGKETEIHFAVAECSLGSILVAQSLKGVCAILMGDDPSALVRDLQDRFPKANIIGGDKKFEKLVAKVIGFVEAPQKGLDLPLDIRGTAFQHRVWDALRRIPPGSTASYTDIAGQIGNPNAVRAVARACAANALAVAIPCHRVVRNDGNLSGYRWGVERKRALLDKEAKS